MNAALEKSDIAELNDLSNVLEVNDLLNIFSDKMLLLYNEGELLTKPSSGSRNNSPKMNNKDNPWFDRDCRTKKKDFITKPSEQITLIRIMTRLRFRIPHTIKKISHKEGDTVTDVS